MAKRRPTNTHTQTHDSMHMRDDRQLHTVPIGPGTRLGEYVITAPVGRGGFGTIWRARHRGTGRDVAVKVLHAELAISPQMVSRLEREARVISMLNHPSVVALHGFGHLVDGRPYLVMEYLPGISVSKTVKQDGPLVPEDVLAILESVGSALASAHARGVIHRDVKASNVMLCGQGRDRRVVLLDFGVAKLLEDRGPALTAPLAAVGSPHCMAPEQIRGEAVDARTDVYGLGALAFYMLTGESPFPGNRGEAMSRHLLEERPRPSDRLDITPAFDDVVVRAMARDPDARFPTALDLVAAFRAAWNQERAEPVVVSAGRAVRAVGAYVDVKVDELAHDEDERIYDDAESILPRSELFLSQRDYLFVHEIGNSALFVLPVPATVDEIRPWLRRVIADAARLWRELGRRSSAHPGVRVDVHLHLGEADIQDRSIEGGSLLEPSTWTPMLRWSEGVWISADAAQVLDLTLPVSHQEH